MFLKKTIREISMLLKKDYPNTYNAVIELEKEGFLKIEKIGKSKLCSVEINQKIISLFSFFNPFNKTLQLWQLIYYLIMRTFKKIE